MAKQIIYHKDPLLQIQDKLIFNSEMHLKKIHIPDFKINSCSQLIHFRNSNQVKINIYGCTLLLVKHIFSNTVNYSQNFLQTTVFNAFNTGSSWKVNVNKTCGIIC